MRHPREVHRVKPVKSFRKLPAGIALAFLIILSLLDVPASRADIAPPDEPPGSNPVPGAEVTQVRMMSEDVLIEVLGNTPTGSLGQARVTAQFIMQNLGNTDEKLAVRFPLTFLSGGDDGYGNYPEIKDFSARVNGLQVAVRRVTGSISSSSEAVLPWAEFDVLFPVGKEVPVEVSYLTEGAGEYPFISFKYILETGAGWKGTIGEADLIVRLPYEANDQNVIFNEQIGWSETTPGSIIVGRELQWKFNELEPDTMDNLQVSILMPSVWKQILWELENTTNNPNDGEAWGRLAKLYKEVASLRRGFRQDPGGLELYRLSMAAYEKCLELLPQDALWHAGYADLLFERYYWGQFFSGNPDHTDALHALDEFHIALELDPANPKVQALVDDLTYSLPEAVQREGDRYVFLWLTATPTAKPTSTLTPTIIPEIVLPTATLSLSPTLQSTQAATFPPTALPTLTATPQQAQLVTGTPLPLISPSPKSDSLPFCGGNIGLILALFFTGSLWWGRRLRR